MKYEEVVRATSPRSCQGCLSVRFLARLKTPRGKCAQAVFQRRALVVTCAACGTALLYRFQDFPAQLHSALWNFTVIRRPQVGQARCRTNFSLPHPPLLRWISGTQPASGSLADFLNGQESRPKGSRDSLLGLLISQPLLQSWALRYF